MGYDVYITRGPNALDPGEDPISLDEWLTHVEADPSLQLDDMARFVVWPSSAAEHCKRALFEYRGGYLVVKTPDGEALSKMRAIACALRARVVGEEGEEY